MGTMGGAPPAAPPGRVPPVKPLHPGHTVLEESSVREQEYKSPMPALMSLKFPQFKTVNPVRRTPSHPHAYFLKALGKALLDHPAVAEAEAQYSESTLRPPRHNPRPRPPKVRQYVSGSRDTATGNSSRNAIFSRLNSLN